MYVYVYLYQVHSNVILRQVTQKLSRDSIITSHSIHSSREAYPDCAPHAHSLCRSNKAEHSTLFLAQADMSYHTWDYASLPNARFLLLILRIHLPSPTPLPGNSQYLPVSAHRAPFHISARHASTLRVLAPSRPWCRHAGIAGRTSQGQGVARAKLQGVVARDPHVACNDVPCWAR